MCVSLGTSGTCFHLRHISVRDKLCTYVFNVLYVTLGAQFCERQKSVRINLSSILNYTLENSFYHFKNMFGDKNGGKIFNSDSNCSNLCKNYYRNIGFQENLRFFLTKIG
jgi:hypothetical protein